MEHPHTGLGGRADGKVWRVSIGSMLAATCRCSAYQVAFLQFSSDFNGRERCEEVMTAELMDIRIVINYKI